VGHSLALSSFIPFRGVWGALGACGEVILQGASLPVRATSGSTRGKLAAPPIPLDERKSAHRRGYEGGGGTSR